MQVKCEMIERRPAKFSVSYDARESEQKTVGTFGWNEDLNEWVADESLLRCLELLASDSNLIKIPAFRVGGREIPPNKRFYGSFTT